MKPFNFEQAKKGKPVITRYGVDVDDFTFLPKTHIFVGVINDRVIQWDMTGCNGDSAFDLKMKPEYRFIISTIDDEIIPDFFKTEQEALSFAGDNDVIIHKIEM